jgi:hypothetical protein
MTVLTVPESMLAILTHVKGVTEVQDQTGRVVGFYAPAELANAPQLVRFVAELDREELERRKQLPGERRTTADVFRHLLTLTDNEDERADLQRRIDSLEEMDRCATP